MNLKEIASLANVSQATVSLVLNNRKGVSDEKREVISKILIDNGYKINDTIEETDRGVVKLIKIKKHAKLVDGNQGFVAGIIDSVEKECRRLGYDLMVSNCSSRDIEETIISATQSNCNGLLILGTEITEEDNVEFLNKLNFPFVVIDNSMPLTQLNCITMNNSEAIYMSVKHLAELGHTNIGFLANKIPSTNCKHRLTGYKDSLKALGFDYDEQYVYNVNPTPEGAYESIIQLLKDGVKFPSALVANNDNIALGAMKAFKEYGIKIPDDISIVGFDNIPFAAISDPPLTTIDVSRSAIGKISVQILESLMSYSEPVPLKILVNANLLLRNSTCRYNKNS